MLQLRRGVLLRDCGHHTLGVEQVNSSRLPHAFNILLCERVFPCLVEELLEVPLSDTSETSTITKKLVDLL